MKFNAVRAMLIASLLIIVLYVLGLFIPIVKNTKESKTHATNEKKQFIKYEKKRILHRRNGKNFY